MNSDSTVFEVAPGSQAITTLVDFNPTNGASPHSGVVADVFGNFHGTTESGGSDASGNLYGTTIEGGSNGGGEVLRLAAGTHALTAVSSHNATESQPNSGLIPDGLGNLYGTTAYGGSIPSGPSNNGAIFKVSVDRSALSTAAIFDGVNGQQPTGRLANDASGNLYGTTMAGGQAGVRTVFKYFAGTGALISLVSFNTANGDYPIAGLVADAGGNLYGTTGGGGKADDRTVFKVTGGTNTLTTLLSFTGANGAEPYASLIFDAAGKVYGTTNSGGHDNDGTVFKIAAGTNTLSALADFDGPNGSNPGGSLIAHAARNLYGTTFSGGSLNQGTVFEIAAGTTTLQTLLLFNRTDGAEPDAGLIADASGNLYGTTSVGGSTGDGTVFELTRTGFIVLEPSSLAIVSIASLALHVGGAWVDRTTFFERV